MKTNFITQVKPVLTMMTLCAMLSLPAVATADDEQPSVNTRSTQHGKMHHQSFGLHHKLEKMAKFLALTPEQVEQIKAIMSAAKATHEAQRPAMQAYHQEMETLLAQSAFDEQALLTLKQKYQSTFEQLFMLTAKTKFDIVQLLTAEQKIQWSVFLQKRSHHQARMPLF